MSAAGSLAFARRPLTWRESYSRWEFRRRWRAIRRRLVKPTRCQRCGTEPGDPTHIHGHHSDYSQPEQVTWLCRGCHVEEHRNG